MKLPDEITFEEAATIPLLATTAALSLFRRQHSPPPWPPRAASMPLPLNIYGASSSLGTFAIKLVRASNIHLIIAIAGSSSSHLHSLLDPSSGDKLIDYRLGTEQMIKATKVVLGSLECHHALDAISSNGTWIPISHITTKEQFMVVYTMVGTAHMGVYKSYMVKQAFYREFVKGDPEWVLCSLSTYMSQMLADGRLTGRPFELIDGGLTGVGEGLKRLQGGQARGIRNVYKVGEVE
ncbi:hypothetical protein BOTNAR_0226g00040 [Botryotinia narcissicola]|uniref:Alcohol dehydrogenase-like C-terminal domain-containing protein n=1 Tax=Botryotinia narcissicola TaxID=278944 RepID=A0A4Z1I9V9_9HELO|nr:hypothetical protein BOTNAR_0226g00040 [Botryotinia narcissicola]